jgi:2-keto-4-pentenoate hydratase
MPLSLEPEQIEHAARLLAEARQSVTQLVDLGDLTPTDAATAEAISDAHHVALGWDVIGWKVGCTSKLAMEILDSPGPFAGRVFDGTSYGSGQLSPGAMSKPSVECEFAFILGSDLPARDDAYSVADVQDATVAVAPAIELVDTRFSEFTGVGYLSLVADHGANGGVVLGSPVPIEQVPDLAAVEVTCIVDDTVTATGTGAAILDDPWNALVWLANHLSGRGIGLSAGQLVMSGTCTGIADLPVGSTATATHAGLGSVSIAHV